MSQPLTMNAFLLSLLVASVTPPAGPAGAGAHPPAATVRPTEGNATLFRGVDLFDGASIVRGRSVLVRDGRIERIGAEVEAPDGAAIVEGAGRTLLPGLIDGHTHDWGADSLRQALRFGVTTQLDMFCAPAFAATMREQQRNGEADDRADLFAAGCLVTAPGGHGSQFGIAIPTLGRPEDADAFVAARVEEGSDYIKIAYEDGIPIGHPMPCLSRESVHSTIDAAHARHKLAVVHVMARERAREAIADGADGLVHVWIDEPIDTPLVELIAGRHAFVIPTLCVNQGVAGVASGEPLTRDDALAPLLAPDAVDALKTTFPRRDAPALRYETAADAVKALKAAGVPIIAGTDAPNPGTTHGASLHRELELLVGAGLTPTEALAAATSVPANCFHLADRGRIAPGARADLLLVDGDPTVDIRATRRIAGIWKNGHAVDLAAARAEVKRAKDELAASEDARGTPTLSPALAKGLISDFDGETLATAFGVGFTESTDVMVGGKSTVAFALDGGGANGSKGCLRIAGTIDDKPQPRWAGLLFSPAPRPMTPIDLSSKKTIAFRARGAERDYQAMIFFRKRGFSPSIRTFRPGATWQDVKLAIADFDGCDGTDVLAIYIGGPDESGPFELRIDDLRLE